MNLLGALYAGLHAKTKWAAAPGSAAEEKCTRLFAPVVGILLRFRLSLPVKSQFTAAIVSAHKELPDNAPIQKDPAKPGSFSLNV
jgi:hypothetical protein